MNPLLLALVQAGILDRATAERIQRSLDPDAARAWAERALVVAVQNGLSDQQARLVELVRRSNGTLTAATLDGFWANEDAALWAVMRGTVEQVAAESAVAFAVRLGGDGDMWRTVNERMLSWVDAYYTSADAAAVGSIPNLNTTSRTQFARAFTEWQRGELETGTFAEGLPQLVDALTPTFGPVRAERIAVTETTRVIVESQRAASEADEFVTHYRFTAAADELVCPICGPLHMEAIEKTSAGWLVDGVRMYPPLHVNCRCQIIEETEQTMRQPLPPEERYQWDAETYAAAQRERRSREAASPIVRTMTGT